MQISFTFFTRCFYSPQHSTAFFPGNQIRLSINSRSSSLANLPPDMHPLASNLGYALHTMLLCLLKETLSTKSHRLHHKLPHFSPFPQSHKILTTTVLEIRCVFRIRLSPQTKTMQPMNHRSKTHRTKKKFWNSFQVSRILKTISRYKTILRKNTSCSLRGKENTSAAFTYQVLCIIDIRLRSVLLFRKQISLPAPDSRQRRIHTKPTTELARRKILLKSGLIHINRFQIISSIRFRGFRSPDETLEQRNWPRNTRELGTPAVVRRSP